MNVLADPGRAPQPRLFIAEDDVGVKAACETPSVVVRVRPATVLSTCPSGQHVFGPVAAPR